MRTRRSRGYRRRCAGPSLVRTRPKWIGEHVPPPPPFVGNLFRSYRPTFISDYESLATHSWSAFNTGSTAGRELSLTGSSGSSAILPPVRWVCYEPAAASDRYDIFDRDTTFTNFLRLPSLAGSEFKRGLINTILPASGNSHFTLGTTTEIEASQLLTYGPYKSSGVAATVSVHRWRHRVNGVNQTLKSGPIAYPWTGPDWTIALAEGDIWELDVWYKLELNALGTAVMRLDETNQIGTLADSYRTLGHNRHVMFGANISDGWDPAAQTYDLTFGSGTWTKTEEVYWGTRADFRFDGIGPGPATYNYRINLDWGGEIAFISIFTFFSGCIYVPQDSSDYIQTTTRPDLTGTQLWKAGAFDWSGVTTFVPLYRASTLQSFRGKRSGTFEATDAYMPSSITVTHVP